MDARAGFALFFVNKYNEAAEAFEEVVHDYSPTLKTLEEQMAATGNAEAILAELMRKDAKGKKDIQMQIGVSRSLKKDMTCTFYVGKYPEAGWAPKVPALWKNGEWNKIRFQAKGDTYTVWLNGEQVANYVDAGYPQAAPVGLQVHGGVKMKVEYRNIAIGEIK